MTCLLDAQKVWPNSSLSLSKEALDQTERAGRKRSAGSRPGDDGGWSQVGMGLLQHRRNRIAATGVILGCLPSD